MGQCKAKREKERIKAVIEIGFQRHLKKVGLSGIDSKSMARMRQSYAAGVRAMYKAVNYE